MSPFILAAFTLVLLVLFLLHLRETRAMRLTLGTLVESLRAPHPLAPPSATRAEAIPCAPEPDPEITVERDSMEVMTQVMTSPLAAPAAPAVDPTEPPGKAAQIAAGLSRPRSQRTGAPPLSAPLPPPVKVAPPRSKPPGPLPIVVPPPRPRTTTLPSMSAQVTVPAPDEDEQTHS